MEAGSLLTGAILYPLDTLQHNVDGFSSGTEACDTDLREQSKKHRNRVLVIADGIHIVSYCRYTYVETKADREILPCVRIDYLARDVAYAGQGVGLETTLRLFIRITKDPKARSTKGIMIDALNCGDPQACEKRWRFFTEKVGFTPLKDDGNNFGYAFMPMSNVMQLAQLAAEERGLSFP